MLNKEPKTVEQLTKELNSTYYVVLGQFIAIVILVFCSVILRSEVDTYKRNAESQARMACEGKGGKMFNDRCVDKNIFIEEGKS